MSSSVRLALQAVDNSARVTQGEMLVGLGVVPGTYLQGSRGVCNFLSVQEFGERVAVRDAVYWYAKYSCIQA